MVPVHSKTFLKRCHSPLFSPVGCPRPHAKKRLTRLCVDQKATLRLERNGSDRPSNEPPRCSMRTLVAEELSGLWTLAEPAVPPDAGTQKPVRPVTAGAGERQVSPGEPGAAPTRVKE